MLFSRSLAREAVHGEDALGAVAVLGAAGVAGGGQGQEVRREFQAGADHGDGLQGLQRGARVERSQGSPAAGRMAPSGAVAMAEP